MFTVNVSQWQRFFHDSLDLHNIDENRNPGQWIRFSAESQPRIFDLKKFACRCLKINDLSSSIWSFECTKFGATFHIVYLITVLLPVLCFFSSTLLSLI